VQVSMEIH